MKTNVYESAVIINAALDDEQIQNLISRVKDTIVNNGGEIRDFEDWGRKRLAYVVNKSKVGYYAIFRFNAPSSLIAKLERFYVLDEQFLRYLTILLNDDAVEYLEKNKEDSLALTDDAKPEAEVAAKADVSSEDPKDESKN